MITQKQLQEKIHALEKELSIYKALLNYDGPNKMGRPKGQLTHKSN